MNENKFNIQLCEDSEVITVKNISKNTVYLGNEQVDKINGYPLLPGRQLKIKKPFFNGSLFVG